jgi:DNA-binding NtrC family response regulator
VSKQRVPDILLVDDNENTRTLRALMLATQGYAVDTISTLAGLNHPWENARYRLVLLSMGSGMRGEMGSWKRIQRDHPTQEFMFLLNAAERLCPLFLDGDQIRDEELSDSFLQRVEAALSSSR